MKFRKKPVVIEAEQFFLLQTEPIDGVVPVWVDSYDPKVVLGSQPESPRPGKLNRAFGIETLEGWHIVTDGDWIITGVKGERYPCKPDIFEQTYERIEK